MDKLKIYGQLYSKMLSLCCKNDINIVYTDKNSYIYECNECKRPCGIYTSYPLNPITENK